MASGLGMQGLHCRIRNAAGLGVPMLLALLLAGCGKSEVFPVFKYVYVSESDCAAGGKVTPDDCRKAIDKALAEHDKMPVRFPTFADCEKVEGPDRCERVAERHYRPRLMGFMFVTKGPVITAAPLYAGLKGATVFRDVSGATFDWERTEGITFSRESIRKAEGFIPPPKPRRG